MELIVISQSKLKIMLTAPDMQYYELQGNHINCVDEETRRAFRHIFDDARLQVGFDTAGERLFVQLYASRDGGCEIFVTKLGHEETGGEASATEKTQSFLSALSPEEEALLQRVLAEDTDDTDTQPISPAQAMEDCMDTPMSQTALIPRDAQRTVILSVPELSSILSVCRRLSAIHYDGESHLYIEDRHGARTYHLLLDLPDGGFYLLPEAYAFLKEYGEVAGRNNAIVYLSEHGRLICPHEAVDILGKL